MAEHSQFTLLRSRRFLPFFITQFLGAFNDNVFKNTLMFLIAYSAVMPFGLDSHQVMNLAAGLFILPFFLFSAIAGELADKYDKAAIIRQVKAAEIVIMCLAAVAFWQEWYSFLLVILFAMGMQSAFFGPVKYAILPQHLHSDELVGGNALVEMGTFVAILLGTLGAGIIAGQSSAIAWVSACVIVLSLLGYFACRSIPAAPSSNHQLKIDWNPLRTTWKIIQVSQAQRGVYLAIMAISWFWFLGSAYLTQFPNFARDVLGGDPSVVTALLAVFTIGIALGSLLCERLSGHKVELGIVPIGSLGVTLFGVDLYYSVEPWTSAELMDWLAFMQSNTGLNVLLDLLGIGIFGGFFIVPLYAYIQQETPEDCRARIIAANNILNALFMVASAISGMILLGVLDLSIPEFFLVIAIMNLVVTTYVYRQVPEFALRFMIWVLSHTMYRVKHQNIERIPDQGAALLVCNHVSYVDALLIAGACRRPLRFVMDYQIFKSPFLGWFFRLAKAIPIAPRHKDEAIYHSSFEQISQALEQGEVVCIFPEGKLTRTGEINEFKGGVETILSRNPVPVIPMALQGLWGSFFSHKDAPAFTRLPKRFWSRVNIICGVPVSPDLANAVLLESQVRELRGSHA